MDLSSIIGRRQRALAEAETAALRRENERLSAEVQRLQHALDGLPVGVVLVSDDGVVRTQNAAASLLGGMTHAGVLVQEAVDRHIATARHTGRSVGSVELYGPPRRVLSVAATALPSGRGLLVTIEDVSERSRLDAVRTDFVANISHELKTPVGAIAVLAETIADDDDVATMRRLATKLLHESHRAVAAIDDLLELSRIELGGLAEPEHVRVAPLFAEMSDRASAMADVRSIAIEAGEVGEELSVWGDRRQLASALGNLVDNAIKYSEPGSRVTLAARADGPWVELTVADEGIGIPARDLDRIFERFYRVDRARSRGTGGTGLGLAIVRHVATNHGGTVTVSSNEGEGSSFTLRLPGGPGVAAAEEGA